MLPKIDPKRSAAVQPKQLPRSAEVLKSPTRRALADELSNGAGRALRNAVEKTLAGSPFSAQPAAKTLSAALKVNALGNALGKLSPAGVGNLFAPGASATPPLTGKDRSSADKAIAAANDATPPDASKIAGWLQAHPDPATQRAFWAYLKHVPEAAGRILDGTTNCTPEQKAVLSSSLGAAYANGDVTDDDIRKLVGNRNQSGVSDSGLGDIIGGTHNPALIGTFCDTELSLSKDCPFRDRAVANALAGLPGDALNAYLAKHPTLISDLIHSPDAAGARSAATVLAHLPPKQLEQWLKDNQSTDLPALLKGINKDEQNVVIDDDDSYANTSPAFGDLLKSAANIQPPTAEVTSLFSSAVDLTKDNDASLQGLVTLYVKDSVSLTQALTADGNTPGQVALSKFFSQALFSPDVQGEAFDGGGTLTDAVNGALTHVTDALKAQFGGKHEANAARALGRLATSLEAGALLTVNAWRKQVASSKKERDLFGGLIGEALGAVLPEIPGAGDVIDAISGKISDALVSVPGRPDTGLVLAFHDLLEGQISKYDEAHGGDLTSKFDAGGDLDLVLAALGINYDGTGG